MTRFHFAIPILNVRSVPASLDYYLRQLGFHKKWDWGDPPTFACVVRDKVELFLCEGAQGHPGTWMSLFVADVDQLYTEYQTSGAFIRMPPTNLPWQTRELIVADPDGHCFRMSSDSTGPADPDALQRFHASETLSQ